MQSPPVPSDDAARVGALRRLGILDTPSEERFDRYTRLVKRLFDVLDFRPTFTTPQSWQTSTPRNRKRQPEWRLKRTSIEPRVTPSTIT